jgi:hypothetical protein
MKTIVKMLALVAITSYTTLANTGNETPTIRVSTRQSNDMKVHVVVNKENNNRVRINLRNEAREVIYSETMEKEDNKKGWNIDLSSLEDGVYQLEVTDGVTTEKKQITVGTKASVVVRKVTLN